MSLHHPERKLHPDDRVVGNVGLRFAFAGLAVAAIGPIPLSLVLAAALIQFAMALTGIYVLLANRSASRRVKP